MTKKQNTVKAKTKELSKGLTDQELTTYVNFLFTNDVTDEKHEEEIKKISNKPATISDATILANYSVRKVEKIITQLMDRITVQDIVLRELGATPEQYEKAMEEYEESIKARMEELKGQMKEDEQNV